MGQITRRMLRSIMLAAFLLAACTPAPAATQDATVLQQKIKDAAASTVDMFHEQATKTQASIPTLTPSTTPRSVSNLKNAAASKTPMPGAPTNTPNPEEVAFKSYCEPRLKTQMAVGDITAITTVESNLKGEKTATIEEAVNLRTQPSRLSRIILILRPGGKVDIIGGPVKTRYQDGTRYIWWKVQLRDQDKLTELTGWVAELSACRQFRFMDVPTPTSS
jgi:predicted small secreted protein